MWKFEGTDGTIREGQPWTGAEGVQHPANWYVWSAEEKAAAGLIEIIEQSPPDSRFYYWSANPDGTITSTPRDLDALKTEFVVVIAEQQRALLAQTDWAYIRRLDTGADVPQSVQDYRNAVRTHKAARIADIVGAVSLEALIAVIAGGEPWPTF